MADHWKNYHLNKMIQDSLREPAGMKALLEEPETVFTKYALTEDEKDAFRAPDTTTLMKIGVHPILAMVYMIPFDPSTRQKLTLDPLFAKELEKF